jgi:amino acid transporter
MSFDEWNQAWKTLLPGHDMPIHSLLIGFGAAWLAFSGLESISQLSPAMRLPLRRTTRWAMLAVIVTRIMTTPFLSVLSINMLDAHTEATQSERFISDVAMISGGLGLKLAVVLSASALLLLAANTAIIGAYYIFLALTKAGFLPRVISLRSDKFHSPHVAISIATLVPTAVILATQGELSLLRRNVCLRPLGRLLLLTPYFGRDSLAIGTSRLCFSVWSAHQRNGPGRLVCQPG